jgi:hypothetical protein
VNDTAQFHPAGNGEGGKGGEGGSRYLLLCDPLGERFATLILGKTKRLNPKNAQS